MFSKLATLALLASTSATPIRRAEPSLTITTEAPSTASYHDLWVVTNLKNTGSQTVEVNPYDTVFSSPETDDFNIDASPESSKASGNGNAHFVGLVAKHVTEAKALRKMGLLKTLAPGETISSNNTLAQRYDLSQSGSGVYKIGAKPKFLVAQQGSEQFEVVYATVQPAIVHITGSLGHKSLARRDMTFGECTATQQSQITLAAKNAQAGSEAAVAYLASSGGDQVFTQWFGAPSSESVSTASLHYTNMNGLFANVKYDCTYCDAEAGTFAMVQPDDISTIHLCGHYWEATPCGTDSQQGTLIHEASHFTAVAATHDIVYRQQDAAALAASNPAQALMNADNHEYFEEAIYTQCSTS